MKKVIIFVLLGTIIAACSTQKKSAEVSKPVPVTKEVHANNDQFTNEQVKKNPTTIVPQIKDTIEVKEVIVPTPQDTVTPVAKEVKKDIQLTSSGKKSAYGHVNMRAVISNMAEYKDAVQHMDSLQKYLANQYELMVQEFQKKEAEYSADTTSLPMVQQMRQQEMQSLAERIRYFQESTQQQLSMEENKLMVPIYEKMRNVIKQVSDDLHLLAVFDDSYLLYSSADAIDITEEVIKKLK